MVAVDERAAWRFVDFFAVTIRNPNTREAYYRAVCRFMDWCERRGLHGLGDVMPIHVAAYVEQMPLSRASVRQHLSAISRCFDWLGSGGVLQTNPATSVQRPRHVVRVGKTPVLSDDEARTLLESIPVGKIGGLRDRALIGAMLYTFGRVGAVIAMDVEDYRVSNHQRMFLLHEKGGKEHQVPAHHRLVE
ncbi:MAG: phage integrase N-terminal SAM-like domain-containing protein [Dehalococcoidia bacterium]|nr:phage integrase N-terminal SAM-like domain-containing protein [Dehalococcoidia bacterium]